MNRAMNYESFIRKLDDYSLERLWWRVTATSETDSPSVLWPDRAQAVEEEIWRRGMLQCDAMDHDA